MLGGIPDLSSLVSIEVVVRRLEDNGDVHFQQGLAERVGFFDEPHVHFVDPGLRRCECTFKVPLSC